MNTIFAPVLLFEIGRLQVFHYPNPMNGELNMSPKEVFWQSHGSPNVYGPFPSIYETMKHYAWLILTQKNPPKAEGKVIYVDFKSKKRVTFDSVDNV